MRPEPLLSAIRVMNPSGTYSVKTSQGEYLIMDQTASNRDAPLRSSSQAIS
jgi:hypothetical protein